MSSHNNNIKKSLRRTHVRYSFIMMILLQILFVSQVLFAELQEWETPPKPGKWYEIHTEYFIINYEEHNEKAAKELASFADSVYKDFREFNGYDLWYNRKKVHVSINGRQHRINGEYSPAPPLLFHYTTTPMLDVKGSNWESYVFTHEFVHYMHLEYPENIQGVLEALVGPIAGMAHIFPTPLWVIEGLATALESEYTNIGRLHNPLFLMPMRADVLLDNKNAYLKYTRLILEDESANFASRYSYGSAMMSYLGQNYGYQNVMDIWQNFSKFPLGLSKNFKNFDGVEKSIYEIQDDMFADLGKRYEEYASWSRGKELPNKDRKSARYEILNESDKGILVYKKATDRKPQFMLYSPEDDSLTKLFSETAYTGAFYQGQSASISRDGTQVVYAKLVEDVSRLYRGVPKNGLRDPILYNDLFVYNTETKKHTRLTKRQRVTLPAIGPNNKYVYATQFIHDSVDTRLIRFDINNPEDGHEVIFEEKDSVVSYKALSPDGEHIAFVQRSHVFGVKLQLLHTPTGEVTTLIQRDNRLWINSLNFKDDNTLMLSGDVERPGVISEFYTIDITTNSWTKVAQDMVGMETATLSSDNTLIYSSHNSYAQSVYVYKPQDLINASVDLDSIQIPVLEENRFFIYQTPDTIANPSIAPNKTPPSDDTIVKKRRIYPFIPSRLEYTVPTVFWNPNLSNASASGALLLGTAISLYGKTLASKFTGLASVAVPYDYNYFNYHMNYVTPFFALGDLELTSSRNKNYLLNRKLHQTVYDNTIKFIRPLFRTTNNVSLAMEPYVQLENKDYSRNLDSDTGASLDTDILYFGLAAPLSWADDEHVNFFFLSRPLAWQLKPSVEYAPIPTLSLDGQPLFKVNNESFVQVPLGKYFATKISNYTSFSNHSTGLDLKTDRFSRYQVNSLIGTALSSDYFSPVKAVQSSSAFDLYINFGNFYNLGGSYFFQIFNAYSNVFVEQTIGGNTEGVVLTDYTLVGNETGLGFVIFQIPIYASVGTAFKVPHLGSSADVGPYMYFSIGTKGIDTNGIVPTTTVDYDH